MTFQPWSAEITNNKIVVNYRTSNCQTHGAANRMIGNVAMLTAAEHRSQVLSSSTLGQRVSMYCKLAVITSTGKLQLLYVSKYHITFITYFSEQIVQWILWVWKKNSEWLMWENYNLRDDTYLYVGNFLGLQEMNSTFRRNRIWERWIEV